MAGKTKVLTGAKAAENMEPAQTLVDKTIKGLTLVGGLRKGEGKWNLRYQLNGRRRDMGLGAFPAVSVATAREMATKARALIAIGRDPIDARAAERRAARPVPTFADIAAEVIEDAVARLSGPRVEYWWQRHLGPAYCKPLLDRPVNEITTVDVARVLKPVWRAKPEVARKLFPAIRRVFEVARIRLRDEHGIVFANPALWSDLKAMGFEAPKALTRGRHPALPYHRMPEFMAALREGGATGNMLLEFIILTNVRVSSALKAKWDEFDFDEAVWSVPVANLKDKKSRREPLRIPLSARVVEIVHQLQALRQSDYVFPGRTPGKPMSVITPISVIQRMNESGGDWVDPVQNRPVVPHGFRASFRTWAEEASRFPTPVIEEAMGHVVGTAVERAYRRTDILEQRRALMDDWARHCEPRNGATVVAFRKPGGRA